MATQHDMDAAAETAEREIRERFNGDPTCGELLAWYRRWYTQAGHKRLGRFLVQLAGEVSVEK